jgi:Rrf2 family iron-sulfur cluster assembly transcriptional regulator
MTLLPRKGLLAIAAVIDVALHHQGRPVSAKALAIRHRLPARHLEPVLQALVRDGILRGVRGPRGGYELAREKKKITADEILRAAGTIEENSGDLGRTGSKLLTEVVKPAIEQAEQAFSAMLQRLSIDDLVKRAEPFQEIAADS